MRASAEGSAFRRHFVVMMMNFRWCTYESSVMSWALLRFVLGLAEAADMQKVWFQDSFSTDYS